MFPYTNISTYVYHIVIVAFIVWFPGTEFFCFPPNNITTLSRNLCWREGVTGWSYLWLWHTSAHKYSRNVHANTHAFLSIYIYVYTHTQTPTQVHKHTQIYPRTHTRTHTNTHTHVRTNTHTYSRTHALTHTYRNALRNTRPPTHPPTHTHMHTHTHIHTYKHSLSHTCTNKLALKHTALSLTHCLISLFHFVSHFLPPSRVCFLFLSVSFSRSRTWALSVAPFMSNDPRVPIHDFFVCDFLCVLCMFVCVQESLSSRHPRLGTKGDDLLELSNTYLPSLAKQSLLVQYLVLCGSGDKKREKLQSQSGCVFAT